MAATPTGPSADDLEFFAAAAQATARNAQALSIEARELFDRGHHARAVALAVSSLEEDGKQSAFMRQATVFDPTFRAALGKRSHPTMQHGEKQQTAVESLRSVFGPLAIDEVRGVTMPLSPIDDIDLDSVSDEIRRRREAALYVDTDGKSVTSPLDTIAREEAEQYVRLAETAATARRWLHRTPTATIADFLKTYRDAWLASGGDRVPDDLEEAARQWDEIGDRVFGQFDFVEDAEGLAAIKRRG